MVDNNGVKPVGVAVLGLGNVGSEVVRIIEASAADLAARIGAPLELRGIGVRRMRDDDLVAMSNCQMLWIAA
jgi:homoserine dehydrogenase